MVFFQNEAWKVKVGLAEMLKGGVIMDVTNPEQAIIAENAGACAVMASRECAGRYSPDRRSRKNGLTTNYS